MEIPHLSSDNGDRGSRFTAWLTMQINSCRSIGDRSLQQEPTKYGQLRTVSATRYDFPYHAARHGAAYLALTTNNAGLVLNGVGMWKIDRQEAAARFSRLYKTRPESSYWRRARDVNRDQIRHHKVKGPQWPSLRGIPESVFVARGKLLTLYSFLNASRRIFHFRESLAIWIESRSER